MFSVSYEIVTPESASYGDCAERGMIARNVTLREAIDFLFQTRTIHVGGIEANDSNVEGARWISVYNSSEFFTGAQETRSLHIPDNVTPSSRKRIHRLVLR